MRFALKLSILPLLLLVALWAKTILISRLDASAHFELTAVPLKIGDWIGKELNVPQNIRAELNSDQILYRIYKYPDGSQIDFYSSFYRSQITARTMHSPLNCYPGSGWEIVHQQKIVFHGHKYPDKVIHARQIIIRRGLEQRSVIFWYQAGERIIENQYKNKFWTLYNAIVFGRTDGLLVTIGSDLPTNGHVAETVLSGFIPRLIDFYQNEPKIIQLD